MFQTVNVKKQKCNACPFLPLTRHTNNFLQVEVGEPDLAAPERGRVEVSVSCSNSLFPKFDERSSGDVNAVLSGALERSMQGVGGEPSVADVLHSISHGSNGEMVVLIRLW